MPLNYDPPPPYKPNQVTFHPPTHFPYILHPWPSHPTLTTFDPPPPYQSPLNHYQPPHPLITTVNLSSHHHLQPPQTPHNGPSHKTHTEYHQHPPYYQGIMPPPHLTNKLIAPPPSNISSTNISEGRRATEQINRRIARLKTQHITWAPLLTVQHSVANRLDRHLLDILLDEDVWPNGSTSLPTNSFISFRVPGGDVCDEDLFQLNVNQTTSYCNPSKGFISSSCINFILASLAEEQGQPTHTPVDVWLIGSNKAAVSPWLSRRLTSDETVQAKSLALCQHFNPRKTQTLIIPINLNNLHWLAVIMDFKSRTITTYDSNLSILHLVGLN